MSRPLNRCSRGKRAWRRRDSRHVTGTSAARSRRCQSPNMSELRERDRRQTFLSIHTVLSDRGRSPSEPPNSRFETKLDIDKHVATGRSRMRARSCKYSQTGRLRAVLDLSDAALLPRTSAWPELSGSSRGEQGPRHCPWSGASRPRPVGRRAGAAADNSPAGIACAVPDSRARTWHRAAKHRPDKA